MDNSHIRDISEAIGSLDPRKLSSELDRYLKATLLTDDIPGHRNQPEDKNRKLRDMFCENVEKEAVLLMSGAAISMRHLMNFRFAANGHPKDSRKISEYFGKLKAHQIGLLFSIGDETEMLRNLIRHSARMREMMEAHSATLGKYAYLTKVLRERMNERPTTLLRLKGGGRKIESLNQTFDEMNEYETSHADDLRKQAEQYESDCEFADCHEVIRESHDNIRQKEKTISSGVKELKQGWELLKSLAIGGYSDKMRRQSDHLISNHEIRQTAFSNQVLECRRTLNQYASGY